MNISRKSSKGLAYSGMRLSNSAWVNSVVMDGLNSGRGSRGEEGEQISHSHLIESSSDLVCTESWWSRWSSPPPPPAFRHRRPISGELFDRYVYNDTITRFWMKYRTHFFSDWWKDNAILGNKMEFWFRLNLKTANFKSLTKSCSICIVSGSELFFLAFSTCLRNVWSDILRVILRKFEWIFTFLPNLTCTWDCSIWVVPSEKERRFPWNSAWFAVLSEGLLMSRKMRILQ